MTMQDDAELVYAKFTQRFLSVDATENVLSMPQPRVLVWKARLIIGQVNLLIRQTKYSEIFMTACFASG